MISSIDPGMSPVRLFNAGGLTRRTPCPYSCTTMKRTAADIAAIGLPGLALLRSHRDRTAA